MADRWRCSVCGRPLSQPGKHVPGIGEVGPECRKKFAALEAYLEGVHPKLVNALYGGATFREEELSQEDLEALNRAIFAMKRAGLRVEVVHTRPGEVAIRVDGVERPQSFRQMFRQDSWSAWAEQVRLRAEARALEREMREAWAEAQARVKAGGAA